MNLQIVPGIRQPNSVHKSEAREVNSLSSVLSRALHNEPQLLYLIPDEQTRRAVSPWFFQTAIQVSRIWGEIYTTDTADGVALWMSPEHNWTIGRIVRTGIIGIPFDLQSQIQISRRFLKLCTSLAKARGLWRWQMRRRFVQPGQAGEQGKSGCPPVCQSRPQRRRRLQSGRIMLLPWAK